AQRTLEQTTLIAPVDGTVMDIAATVGENVGTGPILTLADMETPLVRFWVEEADLSSVAVGNPVNIVFEALPDYTFAGEIVSVDPALVTVDGTPAVQIWASVDLTSQPVNLLSGMTTEVEIVAGEAKGALLVPVQALRELTPGQYAVFVVKPNGNGELEMRLVEVGLKDFVNAEILSGLEAGEVVSTGAGESSDTTSEIPSGDQQPGPGGIMRFLGGG
ncbi:MAG: efflux RND transporter periplasmic adaptor subunit, partial [Anaerolineae bacterium]|nr:efflux RND transporter periplasmic adaptor subunit [Anaerolineae bacterium]